MKAVTDEALVESYRRTGNVHKTAAEVGLNHSSVHERVVRLGIGKGINIFTEVEQERLRHEYLVYRNAGRLRELAVAMGRTVPFLCRQAGELGLTDQAHAKAWAGTWKYMTEPTARVLWGSFIRQRGTVTKFCRVKKLDMGAFSRTMRKFFPDQWEFEVEARAPKQSLYRYGRQFEYRVRDALRAMGYFCMRSPQSRSPIDLVAIRRGAVLFVQCKRHGVLGVAEWNELLHLASSVGAVPLMAEIPAKRGGEILYWRLLSPKDGTKKAQPRGAFLPAHG